MHSETVQGLLSLYFIWKLEKQILAKIKVNCFMGVEVGGQGFQAQQPVTQGHCCLSPEEAGGQQEQEVPGAVHSG